MHLAKKGLRVLGVAESFRGREHSTLAGVVMRRDRIIDGFGFAEVTVGGMDATNAVISLFKDFEREDINLIMLSGCVIAWYNIIIPEEVWMETGVPVVVVTYEDSEGLEEEIGAHFPDDEGRLDVYRRLGARTAHTLRTGYTVYLRSAGIDAREAGAMVEAFTLEGKIPEPLRTARLAARAVMRHRYGRR